MNILKKFGCRIYQQCFRIAMPILPYREPKILNDIEQIVSILQQKNIKSVLIVTDEGLRKSGCTLVLENSLHENSVEFTVYDKTCANPTITNIEEAKLLYLQNNCQSIIAFGGGSSIDCAKSVGALIAYPKKNIHQLKGLLRVWRKLPTFFAIPTTAGTGSEVTLTAVITDSEKKHKCTMNSFPLIPDYAVLDPKVTVTLPKHLTATTGMDALTHAIEAYIGQSTTKETRKLCLDAIQIIFENILTAYEDGKNLIARKNMLIASYKAGIAFSKSYVGYIHAVAHSLGGEYNIPHGLANAVLLPIFLEKYGKCIYKKLHELAVVVKVANVSDSSEVAANKFIQAIREMNKKMEIPSGFSKIKSEDIPKMSAHASAEANPLYPVPKLMDRKELQYFYELVQQEEKEVLCV